MENDSFSSGFVLKYLNKASSESDDNIDVEVILAGGERYTATFATIENIVTILEKYQETGECLSGRYFWATGLILVRDLSPVTIRQAVNDLLQKGELFSAFEGPHDD